MLLGDIDYELGVGLNPQYFLAISNDHRVLREAVDLVWAKHENFIWRETKEHVFESRPLVIYDAPYKARLKDAACHLGEPAVIFSMGQRTRAARRGHHFVETRLSSMMITGTL